MSGSTRSRQKRKLEPISIEELAGTTGMSGFCSFLTRDATVPVPALDQLDDSESSAPEIAAPVPDAVDLAAPALERTALETDTPVLSAPVTVGPIDSSASDSTAVDWDAPDIGAPETHSVVESVFRRRIRIREAVTVQDGHSLAEQAVYDAMYRTGKPYQGDSRILTTGLRTLAELSRMAYSNCKANVRSLVAKLAIEERPGFSYVDGRTYVIYSYREILRRRKSAGLTHVVRTRGVAFVDPSTGKEIPLSYQGYSSAPDSPAPNSSAPDLSASASIASAPFSVRSGAHLRSISGAPVSIAHIENRHLLRNTPEKPSSVPESVLLALREYISDVDDDAASQLWHRCLENAPDATPAEVVYFVHSKARKTGIRMPLGFLLTAVPKCFIGDSFRQFRQERARATESSASRDREFAAEVLKSPEADEEQRQWAKEVLGLDNQ